MSDRAEFRAAIEEVDDILREIERDPSSLDPDEAVAAYLLFDAMERRAIVAQARIAEQLEQMGRDSES